MHSHSGHTSVSFAGAEVALSLVLLGPRRCKLTGLSYLARRVRGSRRQVGSRRLRSIWRDSWDAPGQPDGRQGQLALPRGQCGRSRRVAGGWAQALRGCCPACGGLHTPCHPSPLLLHSSRCLGFQVQAAIPPPVCARGPCLSLPAAPVQLSCILPLRKNAWRSLLLLDRCMPWFLP